MKLMIQHLAHRMQQTEPPKAACYAVSGVFSRHYRKVKAIFGLTDVFLITLAFVAAYQTRIRVHFEKVFYIDLPVAALLLVASALCWVAIGYWFNIYEKLDSAHPKPTPQQPRKRAIPSRAPRAQDDSARLTPARGDDLDWRCALTPRGVAIFRIG